MDSLLPAGVTYTVSMRGKHESVYLPDYLEHFFAHVPPASIDSVFGFVEKCSLYGGRPFKQPQLSDRDVAWLRTHHIGLRIPLTNHFVERQEYESYRWLLDKYHHPLNSIIATNDELAKWIRKDFPHYKLEASVIKNINTPVKLEKAWELFDTAVLPMSSNDDTAFLERIAHKDRIRLFANAGCAYTCPSRICYRSFSEMNKFGDAKPQCSFPLKARELQGMLDFDLAPLIAMGFTQFKLLRERCSGQTGF
jgi:hypothetical protein